MQIKCFLLSALFGAAFAAPADHGSKNARGLELTERIATRELPYGHPNLEVRGSGKKDRKKIAKEKVTTYLDGIDAEKMDSQFGEKVWDRFHGDNKSSAGGAFHLEGMLDSDGIYHVRLRSAKTNGGTLWEKTFDEQPSPEEVKEELEENRAEIEKKGQMSFQRWVWRGCHKLGSSE